MKASIANVASQFYIGYLSQVGVVFYSNTNRILGDVYLDTYKTLNDFTNGINNIATPTLTAQTGYFDVMG